MLVFYQLCKHSHHWAHPTYETEVFGSERQKEDKKRKAFINQTKPGGKQRPHLLPGVGNKIVKAKTKKVKAKKQKQRK